VNQGPLLKTNTPGMTRKPHGYLVLAALCLQTDITFLCNLGEVTVMLVEILGATVQILIRPGGPGTRDLCTSSPDCLPAEAFEPFNSVCCCYLAPFRLLTLYSK